MCDTLRKKADKNTDKTETISEMLQNKEII